VSGLRNICTAKSQLFEQNLTHSFLISLAYCVLLPIKNVPGINFGKIKTRLDVNPTRFERVTFWMLQFELESDALPLRQGSCEVRQVKSITCKCMAEIESIYTMSYYKKKDTNQIPPKKSCRLELGCHFIDNMQSVAIGEVLNFTVSYARPNPLVLT
jgi:hypothetical protein